MQETRNCVTCGIAFVKPTKKQAKCPECKRKYDRDYHAKRSPEKLDRKVKIQYKTGCGEKISYTQLLKR